MFEDKLCQFGFTENEARVYVELLRIGPQPVSVLAKRIKLNRTTVYSIAKSLEKKGIISSTVSQGGKAYFANDPNCLVGYLDDKRETFNYYRQQMLKMIPQFRSLRTDLKATNEPVLKYFEGLEGVKWAMNDALTAKETLYAFLPFDRWKKLGLERFLLRFREQRISNAELKLKAIVPDTEEVRAFFEYDNDAFCELTEILYVSASLFSKMFKNQVNIYDGKVAIMHLDSGQEYAVIMKSDEIYSMQREIFELAWLGCEIKLKNE